MTMQCVWILRAQCGSVALGGQYDMCGVGGIRYSRLPERAEMPGPGWGAFLGGVSNESDSYLGVAGSSGQRHSPRSMAAPGQDRPQTPDTYHPLSTHPPPTPPHSHTCWLVRAHNLVSNHTPCTPPHHLTCNQGRERGCMMIWVDDSEVAHVYLTAGSVVPLGGSASPVTVNTPDTE